MRGVRRGGDRGGKGSCRRPDPLFCVRGERGARWEVGRAEGRLNNKDGRGGGVGSQAARKQAELLRGYSGAASWRTAAVQGQSRSASAVEWTITQTHTKDVMVTLDQQ